MPYKLQSAPKPVKVWLEDLDEKDTAEGDRTILTVRHSDGTTRFLMEQIEAGGSEWTYDTTIMGEKYTVVERTVPSEYMRRARLVWALLEACNIQNEKGKPVLTKDMTWPDFLDAWARLDAIHNVIYDAVTKINPNWGNPTRGSGN